MYVVYPQSHSSTHPCMHTHMCTHILSFFFTAHEHYYCKESKKGTCEVLGTPDPAKSVLQKHIHSLQSGLRIQVIYIEYNDIQEKTNTLNT